MASSSLPSFLSANARPSSSLHSQKSPKTLRLIRVCSFQDEGRSTSRNNIVDEKMSVLKEKMEMVKVKERLERCCRCENGWNYYYYKTSDLDQINGYDLSKTKTFISNSIQLIALVLGTVGSTWLSGTLLLCLVSLIVHLH